MLLYFSDRKKPYFSKGELSMILGLYGDRVKRGEWRDYAIDTLPDMAVFSIYRSAKENPIYAIAKIPSRSILKPSEYAVFSGDKTLKQSRHLSEIIEFFADAQ